MHCLQRQSHRSRGDLRVAQQLVGACSKHINHAAKGTRSRATVVGRDAKGHAQTFGRIQAGLGCALCSTVQATMDSGVRSGRDEFSIADKVCNSFIPRPTSSSEYSLFVPAHGKELLYFPERKIRESSYSSIQNIVQTTQLSQALPVQCTTQDKKHCLI